MTRSIVTLGFVFVALLSGCGKDATDPRKTDQTNEKASPPACAAAALRTEARGGFDAEIPLGMTLVRVKFPKNENRMTAADQQGDFGILFVTGVDGGFIQPADESYGRIASRWAERGVRSVFVQYRNPGELETSLQDASRGIEYLKKFGAKTIVVIGMSFGGAVSIHTAARYPEVQLVVLYAPQGLDTEPVEQFAHQQLLVLHSLDDENVPYESSVDLLARAPRGIRKKLVTLRGALHSLDGYSRITDPAVNSWLDNLFPVRETRTRAPQCP